MKIYDEIVSLGSSCAISMVLRSSYRQFQSLPFDWLYINDFTRQMKSLNSIFNNNLEIWFDINSFEIIEDDPNHNYLKYIDSDSGFGFIHDIPKNRNINDTFNEFEGKYTRRLLRLREKLSNNKHVLFISECLHAKDININEIKSLCKTINNNYNIIPHIYIITWDYEADKISQHDNIKIFYKKRKRPADMRGIIDDIYDILQDVKIKLTLKQKAKKYILKFKRIFLHIIAALIPNRKVRKKIRKI